MLVLNFLERRNMAFLRGSMHQRNQKWCHSPFSRHVRESFYYSVRPGYDSVVSFIEVL